MRIVMHGNVRGIGKLNFDFKSTFFFRCYLPCGSQGRSLPHATNVKTEPGRCRKRAPILEPDEGQILTIKRTKGLRMLVCASDPARKPAVIKLNVSRLNLYFFDQQRGCGVAEGLAESATGRVEVVDTGGKICFGGPPLMLAQRAKNTMPLKSRNADFGAFAAVDQSPETSLAAAVAAVAAVA